jgi:diadenosine tetraphosphatase ApaH/serine/threonine PP2A family protein phosphatase
MRYAILSDIHANLSALQTVLDQLGSIDAIWCLGDIVGYGPDPAACIELVRLRTSLTVQGNHDLACVSDADLSYFNEDAAKACRWTRDQLTEHDRDYLAALPQKASPEEMTLVHGSPADPTWEYVSSARVAAVVFQDFATSVCLVGHTHVPVVYRLGQDGQDTRVSEIRPGDAPVSIAGDRFIVNPGSVGQPRDGNPAASYAVLDTAAETVTFLRVRYPISETQRKIQAARLPGRLARRLSYGA